MKTEINIEKVVTSDDISFGIEDGLKGLSVILDGLEIAESSGQHVWQKESYVALKMIVKDILKSIGTTKESIDYIVDLIHKLKDENSEKTTNNISINIGL